MKIFVGYVATLLRNTIICMKYYLMKIAIIKDELRSP